MVADKVAYSKYWQNSATVETGLQRRTKIPRRLPIQLLDKVERWRPKHWGCYISEHLATEPRQQRIDANQYKNLYRINAVLVRDLIPPRVRKLGSDWHKRRALKIRNTKIYFYYVMFACSNPTLLAAMLN